MNAYHTHNTIYELTRGSGPVACNTFSTENGKNKAYFLYRENYHHLFPLVVNFVLKKPLSHMFEMHIVSCYVICLDQQCFISRISKVLL